MNSLSRWLSSSCPWTAVDLLNHLWQSTAVALAMLVLLAFARPLSAKTRRILAWMALLKFALPVAFFSQLFTIGGDASDRWMGARPLVLPAEWPSTIFAISTTGITPGVNLLALGAAGVWFAGSISIFGVWLIRAFRTRRQILATTRRVSSAMENQITAAAERAGVRPLPRRLASSANHGPGILGLFSPILVTPEGLEKILFRAELESVLIHEFVHLRRRDNLWGTLQALLASLLWFHPLVWLLNRRINVETEKSCDERVMEITGDAEVYADGIVKSVRHALGLAQPGFAGVTTPPVVERIEAIFSHGSRRERPALRRVALVTSASLLVLSGYAGSFASKPNLPDVPTPERIEARPSSVPVVAAPIAPNTEEENTRAQSSAVALPMSATTLPVAPPGVAEPRQENPAPIALVPSPTSTASAAAAAPLPQIDPPPPPEPAPAPTAPQSVAVPRIEPPMPPPLKTRSPPVRRVAQAKNSPPADEAENPPSNGARGYDTKNLDQIPVPVRRVAAKYPLSMRRSGIQGEVVIDFVVTPSGDVTNAFAIRSSKPEFVEPAVTALSQWKFKPGIKGGRAVYSHLQVPIRFTLNEK